MAMSGRIEKVYQYNKVALEWKIINQDKGANTSTVQWELVFETLDFYEGWSDSSGILCSSREVLFGNTPVVSSSSFKTFVSGVLSRNTRYVLESGTQSVTHNLDGTKSVAISFEITFVKPRAQSPSASGTAVLEPIARNGSIINAPNFTDEDSPTITYTCPAGSYATSIQAAISFTGGNDDVKYRDIPKGSGGSETLSYTFNFTTADKNALWSKLNEGSYTTSVRFYIKTVINGTTYWDYVTRTLTFINYTPTLSPTVYDVNEKTLALTGNKNKLIRYMSTAYFDTGAQARKGATLDTQYVRNGDVTVTDQQTGTIEGVTSNTFYYSATDSRGNTERDFTVFNINNGYFIEYVKLTCNVSADQMTAEGNINITVTGKYYRGSLGATQNSLSLRYSLNKENTEDIWTDLGTVTPTVDSDNNYTYTFTISGLDYLSVYKLSVCAKDKVMAEESVARYTLASTPVFDWSKNDFNFNVPVNMTQGYMYPQTILWTGESQLGASDTITLNEPINKQASGIVLIFSLYRDGKAEDVSVHSFFVSRVQTQYLFGGAVCPNLFMMGINSNLSIFGSKYVYISNTTLRGFSGNTSSGTSQCGITFDNSKFVLRYVLGV